MPNSYALNSYRASFTRPNNTTAYPAFSIVSDGNPVAIPAPVRDRPFYIRRLTLQVSPGIAAATNFAISFFNSDPTAFATFADQSFINLANSGAAGIYEVRTTGTIPNNASFGSIDFTVTNLGLYVPSGTYYAFVEALAAFTPTANQKFSIEVFHEYSN